MGTGKLSRYDRAAIRRYHKLQTLAGESKHDIYTTVGLKVGVSVTTVYRVIVNNGFYDDNLRMDKKLLQQKGHVDWDLKVIRSDRNFSIGGLVSA